MPITVSTSNPAVFTTGPIHTFFQTPAGAYWYLGTCETAPRVSLNVKYTDVFNDVGGRGVPFQRIDQGTLAQTGMLLTRYSELAYAELLKFNTSGSVRGIGSETRYNRGSLSIGVKTVKLWQVNDFYKYGDPSTGTPAETNLPPGYLWWAAELSQHEIVKQGTDAKSLMLNFNCWNIWTTATRAFKQYSIDVADFPAELWTDAQ